MVILHDAAVGADGDVNAGLLVVLVAGLGDLNDRRSLTASDALSLAGDADGAAADADLDEVCAGLGQEQEALAVNDVACADLHLVAVVLADPGDGAGLPLAEALGGVDAEHIHTGLYQRGHALGEVAGVDARADNVALVLVEQLVDVLLVGVIVLAENHILQMAFHIDERQGVDLVVPDDVVAVMQAGGGGGRDQLVQRGHELGDLEVHRHAGQAVVAAGHDAQQLAVGGAVVGDSDGGVTGAGLEVEHIAQGSLRGQVGVGGDKALLVGLDAADHIGLLLNGLGAVDEGDTALLGQGNRQLLTGDGLHDGGDHRDVHFQRAGFLALAVLDQRGFQADSRRDTLRGGVAGDQQIFTKGTGRLGKIICHNTRS